MPLRNCVAACVVLVMMAAPCVAQRAPDPPTGILPQSGVPPASVDPEQRRDPAAERDMEQMERDQVKKQNKARQAALKRDTDKLLQLATELKEYVDKTNENVLSLDVIHKAEEIDKLAKSIRDKMKSQ